MVVRIIEIGIKHHYPLKDFRGKSSSSWKNYKYEVNEVYEREQKTFLPFPNK